jgi:CBS domain-containing protein
MADSPESSKFNRIVADDIMTEDVIVIREDMLVGQAAHLMLRERVSGYPVVNAEKHVVGIVTLSDLFILIDKVAHHQDMLPPDCVAKDFETTLANCKNIRVSSIMSKEVLMISPETTLRKIVEAVVKSNVHMFPVMKDQKLIGILGRHDILNAAFTYA